MFRPLDRGERNGEVMTRITTLDPQTPESIDRANEVISALEDLLCTHLPLEITHALRRAVNACEDWVGRATDANASDSGEGGYPEPPVRGNGS
jgi:hypothetical protein